ncbi:protein NRT1/ PTR FAMILY 2.6 [Citrus sinensis]|uniref:Protein NRT1/ PTR FAMILY 2.6 n=1 Tax=Citrus sinensis TaxID=2711 RepID=A0ACB8IVD1_CITSI|nr:protein NRT1/ PTR FAMILY 2.6 [Citrus sinensis]
MSNCLDSSSTALLPFKVTVQYKLRTCTFQQRKLGAATDTHREAQISNAKRGGRTALLSRTVTCLTLGEGWVANLMVYMIQEFHITSINSALISNIVNGFVNLFPVLGAIIADSFLGSFQVIWISSFISLLGTILLDSTATFDSLRPQRCDIGLSLCKAPSKVQFAVLYSGIALACLGLGGLRFTLATMGANQFEIPQHQGIFFNWFFILTYASTVISSAAFVYIEDNLSWRLGSGLNIAANLADVDSSVADSTQINGVGHVLNKIGMVVSSVVESRRLKIAYAHHLQDQPGSLVPMLALWLFPQLVLVGIGEAFHFPGQVQLYYQEFPASLRGTATSMITLILGIGLCLSTALIDIVRKATDTEMSRKKWTMILALLSD